MAVDSILINPGIPGEVIGNLQQKLRTYYVFPDTAAKLCERLLDHWENGDYANIDEGELLALALTMHLQEGAHDEHLWIRYHPEPLPEGEQALRQNQAWQAERRLEAQLDNYGLHRVERLPGNVGYLDLRYFHRPTWAGETAAAAMTFLASASAWIIDLRKCTGGYPGITPDICVPQEQAFEVAYRLALDTLLATLGETPAGPYEKLAGEIQKALHTKQTGSSLSTLFRREPQ